MKNIGEVFDRKNLKSQSKYIRTTKRILIKENLISDENTENGFIFSIIGKNFYVKSQKNSDKIICEVSGVLASKNIDSSLLAVGDNVIFRRNNSVKNQQNFSYGTIVKVEQRNKWISRNDIINPTKEQILVANVQQVIIMLSILQPKYNKRLLDRLLISAEIGYVKPIILLNKTDLAEPQEMKIILKDFSCYKNQKIKIITTSIPFEMNFDKIKRIIKERRTLLLGPSGVGKSSLINAITGEQIQKIREISAQTEKGKHTTSNVIMFNIPSISKNTYLVDTPGIREWGIFGLDKQDLSFYFHEFDDYYHYCKYNHCTHTHEPQCAVKSAVENEKLDYDRYISYLNIYDSII